MDFPRNRRAHKGFDITLNEEYYGGNGNNSSTHYQSSTGRGPTDNYRNREARVENAAHFEAGVGMAMGASRGPLGIAGGGLFGYFAGRNGARARRGTALRVVKVTT
jgi:hypothetical protein